MFLPKKKKNNNANNIVEEDGNDDFCFYGMLLCAWVGRWLGLLAMGKNSILQEIQSRLNQSTGTTVSHFLK